MAKPKIYAFCDAGCKWETVHKGDLDEVKKALQFFTKVELEEGQSYHELDLTKKYKIDFKNGDSTKIKCRVTYNRNNSLDESGISTEVEELDIQLSAEDFAHDYHDVNVNHFIADYENGDNTYEVFILCVINGMTRKLSVCEYAKVGGNGVKDIIELRIWVDPALVNGVYLVESNNSESTPLIIAPYQVFIRYADDETGTNMTSKYDGQIYMGTYVGKEPSDNAADYTWMRCQTNSSADNVSFDPFKQEILGAETVQEAIDELAENSLSLEEENENLRKDLTKANGEIVDLKNALFGTILDTQEQAYENVGVATIDRVNDFPIVDNQKAQLTNVKGRTEVRPIRATVDLGALDYAKVKTSGGYCFYGGLANSLKVDGSIVANLLLVGYEAVNYNTIYNATSGKLIARQSDGQNIVIFNEEWQDKTPEQVKQALNGVMLEYDTVENEDVSVNITTLKSYSKYRKVDLGTLAWHYQADHKRFTTDGIASIVKPCKGTEIANVKCVLYEPLNLFAFDNEAYANSKVIAIYENGVIYIKNPDYTDAATFKQAMQGVYLYYEPNEPTNAELIEEVNLSTGDLNGINEVQDEATETTKTRVIGKVDLGKIPFVKSTSTPNRWSTQNAINAKGVSVSTVANIRCSKYTPSTFNIVYGATTDKVIAITDNGMGIYFIDASFENMTEQEVRTELSGVILYYELATPVIEEGFGEVLINVERGGSIETDSNADITLNHVVYKPMEE